MKFNINNLTKKQTAAFKALQKLVKRDADMYLIFAIQYLTDLKKGNLFAVYRFVNHAKQTHYIDFKRVYRMNNRTRYGDVYIFELMAWCGAYKHDIKAYKLKGNVTNHQDLPRLMNKMLLVKLEEIGLITPQEYQKLSKLTIPTL